MTEKNIWNVRPTPDDALMVRHPEWDTLTCEAYMWERNPGRCMVGFDKDCADHHLAFILDSQTMKFKYLCEHMKVGMQIMAGWMV